jgi:hypothetical protein
MSGQPTRQTRSGRSVKEPSRYEPDPDVALEDDFSDVDGDFESEEEECYSADEGSIVEEDEVYESSDSEDEDDDDETMSQAPTEISGNPELPPESEDEEDVLDWDCLTDDASDGSYSSDDEA